MNFQKLKEQNDIYLKEVERLEALKRKLHKLPRRKGFYPGDNKHHSKLSYSSINKQIKYWKSEINRNNALMNCKFKPVENQLGEVRIIRVPKAEKEVYDRQSECKSMKLGNYNKSVRECLLRAGGRCELTGIESDNLQVHHIFSYNKYPNKRCELSNLVAIDEKVHKHFHKIYGYGNNTLSQWNRFKKNHYGGNN